MLHVVVVNGQECVPWNGEMVPVGSKKYYQIAKQEHQRVLNSPKQKERVSFLPDSDQRSHVTDKIAAAHAAVFSGSKRDITEKTFG